MSALVPILNEAGNVQEQITFPAAALTPVPPPREYGTLLRDVRGNLRTPGAYSLRSRDMRIVVRASEERSNAGN